MSYDKFQKRIEYVKSRTLDMAQVLKASVKLPVDYRKLDSGLYRIFDLVPRGLPDVIRPLLNRVEEVNSPVLEKGKYISRTERVCAHIDAVFQDSFAKAHIMMLGYAECLDILTGKKIEWVDLMRQLGFYFCLALRDELEDFLKYQTASLVALSLSNRPDEAPPVVTRGRFRIGDFLTVCPSIMKYIRQQCIVKRNDIGIQLAMSLYTTKNIAPACSENFVQKAMDKNLKALVTERELPDRIDLLDQVRRTVRELHILATNPVTDNYDVPITAADQRNKELRSQRNTKTSMSCIPSLSACYENARSKGGSLGHLLKRIGVVDHLLTSMVQPLFLGYLTRSDKFVHPVPYYGVLDDEDLDDLMHPKLDRDNYETFKSFGYKLGSRVLVRREPILEPFKVRIISKGEAVPYQIAHNYQPFLWSLLQLSDCFALTGRPMQNEDLNKILRFGRSFNQHCQIISGDYSAATDNLHPVLCSAALDEIVRLWKIPMEDAVILKQCLTGHLIDDTDLEEYRRNKKYIDGSFVEHVLNDKLYRAVDGEKENKVYRQRWGQLMGSFLSFPILCIINYAVTRFSMERAFDSTITMLDNALLINGDDVIFTIPSGQYQVWVKNVTQAGLSPSIGKNYVSRRWGVINSQLYDCGDWDSKHKDVAVKPVPLVKMNLVQCGQHDSVERTKGMSAFIGDALMRGGTLEARMEKLIEGWSGDIRERLLDRAYHYAKPYLDLLPGVSWVLPKCLGGLGLPMKKDQKISLHHKRIATMIACLDEQSRRDVMRLSWLRQSAQVFSDKTNQQVDDIYQSLGFPIVLSSSKNSDNLYQRIIKSNLGYGAASASCDPDFVLNQWKTMYGGWLKRIDKIRWFDSSLIVEGPVTESGEKPMHPDKGLHLMTFEKMITYEQGVWTRAVSKEEDYLPPLTFL